ncbi:MAG: hypothetical protein RR502_05945 [Oscillospiraceae bacterium]
MITKDVLTKAKSEWAHHLNSVTKLSENKTNHKPLIVCDFEMYNFDTLTKQLYNNNYPTSTDALFITDTTLEFIEFKSGFKQRLTKESFKEDEGKCDIVYNELKGKIYICEDFWEIFWRNQKHERQILIDSIRSKSIESYITLEKKILGDCSSFKFPKKIKVKLTVVIDETEIDNMENILGDLSGNETSEKNCFSQIRSALARVRLQKDCADSDYFYDEITIISATDFSNRMKLMTI